MVLLLSRIAAKYAACCCRCSVVCVCLSVCLSVCHNHEILLYFASAPIVVDSSHMTASSSASWSRFSPASNFEWDLLIRLNSTDRETFWVVYSDAGGSVAVTAATCSSSWLCSRYTSPELRRSAVTLRVNSFEFTSDTNQIWYCCMSVDSECSHYVVVSRHCFA